MGLTEYKKKRNFKESPEPTGGVSRQSNLRFVIQKHDASHLHYDFRLEVDGVLKSWAVPKGPSTNPSVKRLAMMVEDHPFDYRNFEGVIPSGYGAGTVIIWDEGFYEPSEIVGNSKKEQERELRRQLKSGKLKFKLFGHKLMGEYALVKAHGRGENAWLLFKIKDKYASSDDITLKEKSVVSNKTLAQIEEKPDHLYNSKRVKSTSQKFKSEIQTKRKNKIESNHKSKSISNSDDSDIELILKPALKSSFPHKLIPMLTTLVDKPFDEPGWIYEVKWDGYRAIAFCNEDSVELNSRNEKSFNDKFYPVVKALENWNIKAVVDGEIVVIGEKGISSFERLQNWRSEADGELLYYVFDLLWYNGRSLLELPLTQRKEILKTIVPEEGLIKLSKSFSGSALDFFSAAHKIGLEGIIAKKEDSFYYPGMRSKEWLKIKANKRQEMVIGGFTKNDNSNKEFSALLVGVYDGNELVYTGKVGTGFSDKTQKEMMKQFKSLVIKKPPFSVLPDVNKPSRFRPDPPHASATWIKPVLVCEVSYTEMTKEGVMRHPSFEGLRIDKKAKDVIREKKVPTQDIIKEEIVLQEKKIIYPIVNRDRKTLLNPTEQAQVRKINGHELKFTNLNKIYWPKEKITKRDLLNYYYQVAPYILPYLKDRPQSMNRHPDGITGESFYFKDVTGKAPEWIETFLYQSDADHRDRKYLVAKDEASLLYMASLGCIEMNPWSSRVESKDYPDWCMIDLDPAPTTTFNQVIETARVTKEILDQLGVPGYPKTSGSTGMHIYIPLGALYTYEQSKEFARVIATLVHQQLPDYTSIQRTVKSRGGKMYIDFLQNRPQATISAPYSVRPKPGATVSMPLYWEEVKKGLKMSDFTIFNALDRLRAEGDIFKPVLGKGIDLGKVIKMFNK